MWLPEPQVWDPWFNWMQSKKRVKLNLSFLNSLATNFFLKENSLTEKKQLKTIFELKSNWFKKKVSLTKFFNIDYLGLFGFLLVWLKTQAYSSVYSI